MKHKLEDISGWRMAEHGFPESRWTVMRHPSNKLLLVYRWRLWLLSIKHPTLILLELPHYLLRIVEHLLYLLLVV